MTQNRKRTLEQTNDATNPQNQQQNGQSVVQNGSSNHDSEGPSSKRSLLNPNQTSKQQQQINTASAQNIKQMNQNQSTVRPPQKSNKPMQNINLPNSPEEIYYVAVPDLK
jgi:hypothetical protein